jgi:hypothetical protein
MPTFDSDRSMEIRGVPGRLTHRTTKPGAAPGLWCRQRWISETRPIEGYGDGATIRAELRFDDECGNGHNTFALTGTVYGPARKRPGAKYASAPAIAGGCLHEDVARVFPELAPLVRWHLCSSDEPMHYLANTVFHAGDRDHNGRRAGEPLTVVEVVQFGEVPIHHRLTKGLGPFLRDLRDNYDRAGQEAALEVLAVAHKDGPGKSYNFAPKYQFAGQKPLAWHECAFDTEQEAVRFADAFLNHSPRIYGMATSWSEGKARDLDAARSAAIWPEATDAELSAEPEALRAALTARLPALTAAFRADIEGCGFLWAPEDYRAA